MRKVPCIEIPCARCQKPVRRRESQRKRRTQIFCSPECYRPTKTITCQWCGKELRKPPSEIAQSARNFCSRDCWYAFRRTPITKRFWQKVSQGGKDECWEWQGYKDKRGYGHTTINRKMIGAHRAAFILSHNSIPDGMLIQHTCDNPSCCNPNHLRLGKPRDNSQDMIVKQRQAYGERNGLAKLTTDDVRQIRQMAKTMTQKDIAASFDIKQSNVSEIVRRKTWKHIP